MDRFEPVLELLGQPENPLSIAIADHRERMKRAEAKKDAEEKVELSSNAQDSRDDKLTTGGRPSDNQITNEALGNKPATVGPPTFTRISETLGVKVFRGRRSEVHLEILEDMHERSDTLCPDDIEILEKSQKFAPFLLGRTFSKNLPTKTKGYHSRGLVFPSAVYRKQRECHRNLSDIPKGAVKYMAGQHLTAGGRNNDELLSWSQSLLCLLVLAIIRKYRGQSPCNILFIDRRKATTGNSKLHQDGKQAPFYSAIRVLNTFDVPDSKLWGQIRQNNLRSKLFTAEYLSHGIVEWDAEEFREVDLQELYDNGLLELHPELRIPEGHVPENLYSQCVAMRRALFPERRNPFPERCEIELREINIAERLARLFVKGSEEHDTTANTSKAPLHLVLMFLGLRSHRQGSEVLDQWIKKNYTGQDLKKHFYPGMHRIADHLFEVIEYVQLCRDACVALGVKQIDDPSGHLKEYNSKLDKFYREKYPKKATYYETYHWYLKSDNRMEVFGHKSRPESKDALERADVALENWENSPTEKARIAARAAGDVEREWGWGKRKRVDPEDANEGEDEDGDEDESEPGSKHSKVDENLAHSQQAVIIEDEEDEEEMTEEDIDKIMAGVMQEEVALNGDEARSDA